MVDDLNAPLGQDKQKRLPKLPLSAPQLLAGALGLSGVVVVAWAAFVTDPLGRRTHRRGGDKGIADLD